MSEDISIFEEINEELKNDQLFAFFQKHRKPIITVVVLIAVLILACSLWYNYKIKQMERITTALINVVQSPTSKNEIVIAGLLEDAPSELKPILTIMKSGKKLSVGEEKEKNLTALLELSRRHGVDVIWKDLALIIYITHSSKPSDESIKLLKPLTESSRPFRFTAWKLIAMIYKRGGDHTNALENFKKIIDSPMAPNSLRNRVLILSNHIKSVLEK